MPDTERGSQTLESPGNADDNGLARTETTTPDPSLGPPAEVSVARCDRICLITFDAVDREHPVTRQAQSLMAAGMSAEILCADRGGGGPSEEEQAAIAGPVIKRIPLGDSTRGIGRVISVARFVFAATSHVFGRYSRSRPGIVQVPNSPAGLLFVAVAARLRGAGVIVLMTEPDHFVEPRAGVSASIARISDWVTRRVAHRIVVSTREMRDRLGEQGADRERVCAVASLPEARIDRLAFQKFRVAEMAKAKKEERRRGVFRIVAFERHADPDMWALLVPMVSHLLDRVPGVELCVLASPGPSGMRLPTVMRPRLAEHIRRVVVEDMDTESRELLSADLGIVVPARNTRNEVTIPREVFELAALEKPIIAQRLTALCTYFPEDTILYFQTDNARDLADYVYHAFAYPKEMSSRGGKLFGLMTAYRWPRESRKYVTLVRTLARALERHRENEDAVSLSGSEAQTPESAPEMSSAEQMPDPREAAPAEGTEAAESTPAPKRRRARRKKQRKADTAEPVTTTADAEEPEMTEVGKPAERQD